MTLYSEPWAIGTYDADEDTAAVNPDLWYEKQCLHSLFSLYFLISCPDTSLFNIQLLEFIDSSKFLLSRPLVSTAIALVIMWEFQKILMFSAVSSMMLKIPGNA